MALPPGDKAAVLSFLSEPSRVTGPYKPKWKTRKQGAKKCSMCAVKVEGGGK